MEQRVLKLYFTTFFLLLFGCKKQTSDGLIVFDVNGNYPVKMLDIEDVADIEYLTLEINDDFLFSYYSEMTDNYILCTGEKEIIFFDRTTGKVASKISRYGNGPGEYYSSYCYAYNEKKDELFNIDGYQIKVYGRDGTFKRQFPFLDTNFFIYRMFDFDEDNLLLYGFPVRIFVSDDDGSMKDSTFMLVSKKDGFIEVIPIHFEERIAILFQQERVGDFANVNPVICNGNDFLLTDYSSDTVYRFTPDRKLIPVLIREPSIQKMNTKIFLHSWLETGKYLFFSTQKIDLDWKKWKWPPEKGYLMEKNSGKFFQTHIQMRDYKGYELILGPSVIFKTSSNHTGIVVWNVSELQEANAANKLSGKLKEMTDRLDNDDEYVFMILKFGIVKLE